MSVRLCVRVWLTPLYSARRRAHDTGGHGLSAVDGGPAGARAGPVGRCGTRTAQSVRHCIAAVAARAHSLHCRWAIFDGLAKVGDAATRAIAKGRADNIQPLVAYCAYRGGVDVASFAQTTTTTATTTTTKTTTTTTSASAASAPTGGSAALLDTYLVNSRRAEAQQAAVELDGGARRCAVDPQSPLGALIVLCRFRGLESAGVGGAGTSEGALTGACCLWLFVVVFLFVRC